MRSQEEFRPHIGTTFVVTPQRRDDQVKLELTEIADHSTEQLDAFSLMFLGPKDQLFDQGIQAMDHESLGRLSMFLTPILSPGLAEHLVRYEAVYSRIRETKH